MKHDKNNVQALHIMTKVFFSQYMNCQALCEMPELLRHFAKMPKIIKMTKIISH